MKITRLIDYLRTLPPSTMGSKHYSVLYSKNKILSTGVNCPGMHSEIKTLRYILWGQQSKVEKEKFNLTCSKNKSQWTA